MLVVGAPPSTKKRLGHVGREVCCVCTLWRWPITAHGGASCGYAATHAISTWRTRRVPRGHSSVQQVGHDRSDHRVSAGRARGACLRERQLQWRRRGLLPHARLCLHTGSPPPALPARIARTGTPVSLSVTGDTKAMPPVSKGDRLAISSPSASSICIVCLSHWRQCCGAAAV